MEMIRVCFVCLGNICRSPTAEGVMNHLLDQAGLREKVDVDSAGTSSWHVGEKADSRSRAAAEARGIPLLSRSAQFNAQDFEDYDHVVAMDRSNLKNLENLAPNSAAREKLSMLRAYDPDSPSQADVPDPYYGGPTGFDDVLDICIAGCAGFLEFLRKEYDL